jgi:ABC-type multidrug transport system fused ATPase/permease subunit
MTQSQSPPGIFNYYFDFMNQNKLDTFMNMFFLFLIPIQDVAIPHIYGGVIDTLQKKGTIALKPLLVVIAIMVIVQIGFFFEDWHNSYLYPRLQDFIRSKLVRQLLDHYEQAYKELPSGEIISMLLKAPLTMTYAYEIGKNTLLPFILTLIIATIYFLFIDKILAIGLFILGFCFLCILYYAPIGCNDITLQRDHSFNVIYEQIDDMLRNLFSIYGSDTKDKELDRLRGFEDTHQTLFRDTMTCIFKHKVFITPLTICYLSFFIFRSYQLVKAKKIGAGKFVPIFMIMSYLLNFMIYTNDQFRDIIFEWGIVRSADKIINAPYDDTKHVHTPAPADIPIPSGIGMQNITFRYKQSKRDVLQEFNLHITPGEKVVIMGDIGSGKSTVLKLLLRYYEPRIGTVYWNGRSYDEYNLRELRKSIGYVPQVPVLFDRTVYENMTYGLTGIDRASLVAFLEEHDLMKEFDNLDNGLDTIIGKNGSVLSGGQRQLVWCLRVLLSEPEILILDEPTSSIDTHMKQVLNKILQMTMKGKTVIMVTHDEFLLSTASRVIIMKAGQIISDRRK